LVGQEKGLQRSEEPALFKKGVDSITFSREQQNLPWCPNNKALELRSRITWTTPEELWYQ